jgi:hypothetical protein
MIVIRVAGAALLVLGFAISAQAQGSHLAAGASSSLIYSGGAGTGFGGSGLGPSSFSTLPHIPRARFQASAVSGDSRDFVPSTYVPYKVAVAEGRSILAAVPESLGQFARDNEPAARARAKFELVQDHHGYAVIRRL